MSQSVGLTYKSRIPSFADDASIEEALRVYHYGVDNYTTQPIPNDSIEGNFRTINTAITAIQGQLSTLNYVKLVSVAASPNIITPENKDTVPLTIKGFASQAQPLQLWETSTGIDVASISNGGYLSIAGYASIGSVTQSTTTALNINVIAATDKGIVVKAKLNQSANIQEWYDKTETLAAWVNPDGKFYYKGIDITTDSGGLQNTFFLMGA